MAPHVETGGMIVVDVTGYPRPDLTLVDLLARVCLAARGLGAVVVVRTRGDDLGLLLDLTGLSRVLRPVLTVAVVDAGSQVRRQPEPREEPGVEEVVDVPDVPVADLQDLDRPRLESPTRAARLVLGERGSSADLERQEP